MKKLILTTILMCLPLSLMASIDFQITPKSDGANYMRKLRACGYKIMDVKMDEAENGWCLITFEIPD